MKESTAKLTGWAIDKIKKEFPEDVALLIALEDHETKNDGHGVCFDYFVPATERGNQLSQTFIVEGIGHDLYGRDWERMEKTADLIDHATFCLGNAKILYSRSKADVEKFQGLQERLRHNLQNKELVYGKALERLEVSMELYRTLMFEESLYKVRMAVGHIFYYLSEAIYYLNGSFALDFHKSLVEGLKTLDKVPQSFIQYYESVIYAKDINDLKNIVYLGIKSARRFIGDFTPQEDKKALNPNFEDLAFWYQELSLYWRRQAYYVEENQPLLIYEEACSLQHELMVVQEEFGLKEMDLMSSFDGEDLRKILDKGLEIEAYIISEIQAHGAKIVQYETVDDFIAAN